MTKKARQAYQYEAPVTPSKWTGEEQRFSLRVKAALEDLYQKFGRLSSNPAADSEKLGGKAPEYYVHPVNLLDNSDFTHPVNQRGITSGQSISAYGYFIDRWRVSGDGLSDLTLSQNGLGLPNGSTIMQSVPDIRDGTVVTFAIGFSSGETFCVSGTINYTDNGEWLRLATGATDFGCLFIDTYAGNVDCVIYCLAETTIQWAALYEGSYTAETLPPYVPKGYRAELDACHERFYRFDDPYSFVAAGFFDKKGAYAYLAIDTPYLNGDAKATVTGKVHLSYPATVGNDSPVTSTILSGAAAHDGKIRLQCNLDTANSALANMPCAIQIRAGDYLEISRDL